MDKLSGILIGTRQAAEVTASLSSVPPAGQFILRGRADAIDIAGMIFRVPLPVTPCRSETRGDRSALWLGPDEFLLLAPLSCAHDVETALNARLTDISHSLVDVGHRNVALEIAGPEAANVLNAGCPLDLDDLAFPVGSCTRTILAKAQIVLWRTAPQTYYVSTWRSFAGYVWQFLDEARGPLR